MLTFTRAAAAEFADKQRVQGLGEEVDAPSTVHAFALRILRELNWAQIPQPVRIADDWETAVLIRKQLSRLLRAQGFERATASVVKKLEAAMSASFESLTDAPLEATTDRPLMNAYLGLWSQHRQRLGYTLRSELPYRAGAAIEDHGLPALHLDLLLVDEYQDLNRADIRLIELVGREIPVIAIGDEDQSIYSYRNAAPEGIRQFPAEFGVSPADDYQLTISARCGRAILNVATAVIEGMPGRPPRPAMTPLHEDKPGVVAYLRFTSESQEAKGVAKIVAARRDVGIPLREIAILARSGIDSFVRQFREEFDLLGIPIASDDWVTDALETPELRRLRSMAYLAMDRSDSLAWLTLLHLQAGIGNPTIDAVYSAAKADENFGSALQRVVEEGGDGITARALPALRRFYESVIAGLARFELPEEQDEPTNWAQWLSERATEPLTADVMRLLNLVSEKARGASLAAYLGQIEPLGKDFALAETDAVRFMTMTKAKGLTVNTAVLLGVEDGWVPMGGPNAGPEDEERRLLYVGLTRATDYCIITMTQRRTGPLARRGAENVQTRSRSPLLTGIIAPQAATQWLRAQGWEE
jgi:DNA helicase-2/ATP-dependent DNA helicase PcrA